MKKITVYQSECGIKFDTPEEAAFRDLAETISSVCGCSLIVAENFVHNWGVLFQTLKQSEYMRIKTGVSEYLGTNGNGALRKPDSEELVIPPPVMYPTSDGPAPALKPFVEKPELHTNRQVPRYPSKNGQVDKEG